MTGHDEAFSRVVVAMKHDEPEAIQLLRQFVDGDGHVDALYGPGGISILRLAVEHLHFAAIEELAQLGANLDLQSGRQGLTALHHAVDIDIDKVLQASPRTQGWTFESELDKFGFEASRLLVRLGASTDIRSERGTTPRQDAARRHESLGPRFDQMTELA